MSYLLIGVRRRIFTCREKGEKCERGRNLSNDEEIVVLFFLGDNCNKLL